MAIKRVYLTGEGGKRQEWGKHLVILNKRGNPCHKGLPFVGKVFVDDVWSGGTPKDGPYPLLSCAIAKGLYHPRCKNSHTTYLLGISTAPESVSKEEKKELEEEYIAEQKEAQARLQAEKSQRIADGSLDEEKQRVFNDRAGKWEKKVEECGNTKIKSLANSEKRSKICSDSVLQETFGKNIEYQLKGNKDYKTALKTRFNTGDNIAKAIFKKYVQNDSIAEIDYIGNAYYSYIDKKVHLNILRDMKDTIRGAGSQFFHEHGHYIDNHAGNISIKSEEYLRCLQNDLENYLLNIEKEKKVDRKKAVIILEMELENTKKASISDIIDGITKGRIVGCASHSKYNPAYWDEDGRVNAESFAHMFEACFDKEKSRYMSEYFPTAVKEFKNILKEIV